MKSITKENLPPDISKETCEFINLFRRKTADEKDEWNFYIDYENNQIIHCMQGTQKAVKDGLTQK